MCGIAARSVKNNCLSGAIWISSCVTTYCLFECIVVAHNSAAVVVLYSGCSCGSHSVSVTHLIKPRDLVFLVEASFCFASAESKFEVN